MSERARPTVAADRRRIPVGSNDHAQSGHGRALVVSHPCVVPANQSVFAALATKGRSIDLVVPNRWKHEYADKPIKPMGLPGLKARLYARRVALQGRAQRHVYVSSFTRTFVRGHAPRVVFLEEESFSYRHFSGESRAGGQASRSVFRPTRIWTGRFPCLRGLFERGPCGTRHLFAARSPRAKQIVEQWGARGRVEVVPHAVPGWRELPRSRRSNDAFTIGFAGRLVEQKGVRDLVAAASRLGTTSRLLFVGNGPLREEVAEATSGVDLEILTDMSHEDMPRTYSQMDVLVLPSRTTPTWTDSSAGCWWKPCGAACP
jgi:glycosyltransferase involved in cell wall biosynthesis